MKKLTILISIILLAFAGGYVGAGTFTKGKLAKEDASLWDGTETKTSSRSTSTGYSLTLHDFDWVGVDVLQVYGAGINRTSTTIASALTGVGAVNKVGLWLSPGAWVISDDHTLTANITLICPPGVDLQIGAGKTFTVQGNIIAGPYQIFSGAGTVSITGVFLKHDQWEDGAGNAILPTVDDQIDLGSAANQYKDGYFDGKIYADEVDIAGNDLTTELSTSVNGLTATAAEINKAADGIVYAPITGDATAGRVLRSITVRVYDGTNANTLKVYTSSELNGDVIGEEDNLAKDGSTTSFELDSNGYVLKIKASAISGNCVGVLSESIYINATGTALLVASEESSGAINIVTRLTTANTPQDLAALVDGGEPLCFHITYITSA
jgi:hypothetical protein